jgi:hypothetical protein
MPKYRLRVVKEDAKLTRVIQELATILAGALALVACTPGHAVSALPAGGGETLIAAGDIAQCSRSGYVGTSAEATAGLIDSLPGTVLALGDLAYQNGTQSEFRGCYEPTWGRFRDRTKPTPGNHEHNTRGAAPYYAYWGERAGVAGEGFYSFELGTWHIIALNSNIIDGPLKSKQEEWLAADLKRHPTLCALAFFHHPRFSSGGHGNDPRLGGLWRILYLQGVDVVLGGHDHDYERFAPQDPDGHRDKQRGIREFVVGTGGAKLTPFLWIQPNSEVRINGEHGILRMTLWEDRYRWEFLSAPDGRLLDVGRGKCH